MAENSSASITLPSTTLRTDMELVNGHIPNKIKGTGIDAALLRIMDTRVREHVQPSASDLRMVVRIQRKNKHPHSTKKHK
jgi:hypothetical protein